MADGSRVARLETGHVGRRLHGRPHLPTPSRDRLRRAEDVSAFLIGIDVPNPELADQFLQLLNRVTEPADRLRLFGMESSSPAAPRLLAAIEQFNRNRGSGRRQGIFGYLRSATVELAETHKQTA